MKVSAAIDRIDSGAIALPEFQRGYVWRRWQVRDLVDSLYRRFPVGSLLLWETATESAPARGDAPLQRGYVSLLLDGQQRVTSLYGLIKGEPPPFFDGDPRAFSDLRFHVDKEEFHFYAPVTMRDDPLWLDVGEVLRRGPAWAMRQLRPVLEDLPAELDQEYLDRLNRLHGIRDIVLHEEQITGEDKDIDVVVDLFNRVNASGTRLSKGDLALAKIGASWPEARDELKARLSKWDDAGFHFTLEWLLRNVTAIVTGQAELVRLTKVPTADVRDGVIAAERAIDLFLNLASSRLGLDHDRVLGGVGAIPVISRYLAAHGFRVDDAQTADRLLFWYVHCLLWGRHAGSTETVLNIDLQRLESPASGVGAPDGGAVERLVSELRRQRGDLTITADHFEGSTRGARFYPLLYMLSRVSRARDLLSGLELSQHLLGRHSNLEVHHIFPKAQLYRHGYGKSQVNALANFAFLTTETNRSLGDRLPAAYLEECERRQPGVLASQWIPHDPALWEIDRFPNFLARRRELLAEAADSMLGELRRGTGHEPVDEPVLEQGPVSVWGADDEEATLAGVRAWMHDRGMERGIQYFALLALDGQVEEGVLDLAWPDGLEFGGERIALLLDEPAELKDIAARHGFRCFTSPDALLAYAEQQLADEAA